MLMTMILMGAVPCGGENSKYIDYTPDILSDEYWNDHDVVLVRVTAVEDGRVHYEIVLPIWGAPEAGALPLVDLWFGMQAQPLTVAPGQLWIFYLPNRANARVPVMPVDSESSPLVERLRAVARLHAQPDDDPLREAAFDADPLVARYALGRLLRKPSAARGLAVARLRDDETRAPHVRLLANELIAKLEGKPRDSAEEYAWLTSAITRARAKEFSEVAPLVDRLLEFADRRAHTAALLTKLTTDGNMPKAVRIAAYGTFQDFRLLHPEHPDNVTDQIVETCVKLLKDPDVEMRRAGAALLESVIRRVTPLAKAKYIEWARKALVVASAVEKDEATRQQMNEYESSIESMK